MLRKYKTWTKGLIIAILLGLSAGMLYGSAISASSQELAVFEAVWETVNENFYDPEFNGVDWAQAREQYRPQVSQASSKAEKAALINDMLAELKTSHTRFYTAGEPAYYQLLGIFYPRSRELQSQLEDTFPNGKLDFNNYQFFSLYDEWLIAYCVVVDRS